MKNSSYFFHSKFFLIILFTLSINLFSFSQPPGMPPCAPSTAPGETACTATPICNLNGYCGRTLSSYTADAWQALKDAIITCSSSNFDQLDVNNDSYLKFVAGAASITFDVYVYDCIKPVTTKAIQLAVFSAANCGSGPVSVKYCNKQMNQQNTPHNVTINNLTPGETYYILIDGYSSQNCAYSFVMTSGVNLGLSLNLSQTTVCPNGSVTAIVSGGSGTYTWSGDTGLGATTGTSVTVTPPVTPGVYNYNVESTGSSGQMACPTANETDFSITVANGATPIFTQLGPFCAGQTFTLPATSTDGVTGTWSPAVNTAQTTTYTFTPASGSGSCAGTTTMTVAVSNQVIPSFTQLGPFCAGQTFTLPATSTNGVTGTWSPAINTAQTTTYTFTPASGSGSCAGTTTMTVAVSNQVTPSFTQLGPFCAGQTFTLPATSTNGVTGTWSPAVNTAQTTTYTFTPASGSGSCAGTTTMTVTVSNQVTPTFTQLGPFCIGQTFTLPTTSTNGVSGTWSPAIDNTQTTTYTFTPTAGSGSCAATSVNMEVVIQPMLPPTITPANGSICMGESLTLIGSGADTYSWSPATGLNVSTGATVIASPTATTTYTLTGTSGSGCAATASVTVTVLTGPLAGFVPSVTVGEAPLAVVFSNTSVNANSYVWNFGNGQNNHATDPTVSTNYAQPGNYEVILVASNGVCTDTAKANILVTVSDIVIHVPNVFTPNGDQANDVFFIETNHAKTVYVELFNRWGNRMAILDNTSNTWDGGDSPTGVYFYIYRITDFTDKIYEGQGFFHLERGKE